MFPLLSRHLLHFIAVYDCGSIRLASEKIGLTQPALSKSLKQLEDYLGVNLFERSSSGVIATPFATTLRRRAEIIRREVEYTQAELDAVAGYDRGHLRIGSGPVWSYIYMPRLVAAFFLDFPHVSLELETGSGTHFLHEMMEGRIDLYFGARPGPDLSKELNFTRISEFRLRFFAKASHALHQLVRPRLEDLLDQRWMGFSRQEEVHRLLAQHVIGSGQSFPQMSLQVESFETLARVALRTDHVIVGTNTLEEALAERDIHPIEVAPELGTFEVGMMCRGSLLYYRPVQSLLEGCQRLVAAGETLG